MDEKQNKLEVIEGGGEPKAWRRRRLKDSEQVTCWQCKADIGIETSAVVKVTIAARRKDLKKVGGKSVWACAFCLGRGKLTQLIKA